LDESALMVASLGAVTVTITLVYFRFVRLPRPPLGKFEASDLGIVLTLIAGAPYLYIALPPLAVSSLIGVGLLSTLSIALKPLLGRARWIAVATLLTADALLVSIGSTPLADAANDALAVLAIAAIANVWAQSGMRACDAALLAAGLAVYDPVATSWLGLTGHLFTQIRSLPFAPLLAWPDGHGHAFVIGAGDVLIAALLPTVVTKAFGSRPGVLMGLATVGTIAIAVGVSATHVFFGIIPVMVGIGPVAVVGWLTCRHRCPSERTIYEYRTSGARRPPRRHQTRDGARANRPPQQLVEDMVLGAESFALPKR
jgi:hypothetical protein